MNNYVSLSGVSNALAGLKDFIRARATEEGPLALIGERGLRQEEIARAVHQASERRGRPFVAFDAHCIGAEGLLQLLFGPEGAVEANRQGTVFINELVNLPVLLQQRIAIHLEEQRLRDARAHARLLIATEYQPEKMCAENRLAYHLIETLRPSNTIVIQPLRERSEDIPALAEGLLAEIARRLNKGACLIAPEMTKLLTAYDWPGNIDELEAVLESAVTRAAPPSLDEELLPVRVRTATLSRLPPEGIDLFETVEEFERRLIAMALKQSGNVQTRAAKLLGLLPQNLNMKIKRGLSAGGNQPS